MKSLTVRIARSSARHPWRAIVGWLVFVVLCLAAGGAVGMNSARTADYRVGEAGRAEAVATEGHLERRSAEQVLISARSGALDTEAARSAVRDLTARMERLTEVAEVAAPVPSADGRILMVEVALKGEERDAKDKVDALTAQTAAVQRTHPELLLQETGSPSISKGVDEQRGDDLALSEKITLPVTLLTLLLVFGSLTMAAVPLLLALSSIAAAVVVVDDHTVMRAGVVALLAGEDGIEIVGEAGDGRAALELVERHDPDVALVDLRMPVLDGVRTTTEIVARHPRTRVLILTTYDTDADIERGVEAGAIGYLLKDTTREQLVDAIRAAARGETVLAPRVAQKLVARLRRPVQEALTARETDVLGAVADGLTNAEIGRRLVISEATVKTHLLRLFAKLDVNDRTRAVVVAMERGLLRRP
ncbi:response regulator [Streptomyces sp. NPDC060002]|uniref:response regulator n=1 Tax=Streptomyces sp. NPDC060002 TaxID=3347033 RepID=UPI0036CF68F1